MTQSVILSPVQSPAKNSADASEQSPQKLGSVDERVKALIQTHIGEFTTPPKRSRQPEDTTTPSPKFRIICTPQTPNARAKAGPSFLFNNKIETIEDRWVIALKIQDATECYTLPTNEQKTVIKQPPQKGSCGAGATLMLYTDLLRKNTAQAPLSKEFLIWYSTCSMAHATEVCRGMKMLSMKPQIKVLHFDQNVLKALQESNSFSKETKFQEVQSYDQIIKEMKEIRKSTGHSFIMSITHPIIEGHWILVDEIEDDGIYVRDPYSGLPYKLTYDELEENLPETDEIKLIYLAT